MKFAIAAVDGFEKEVTMLCELLSLPVVSVDDQDHDYLLLYGDSGLALQSVHENYKPLRIDFCQGLLAQRKRCSAKQEDIVKAIGLLDSKKPMVLDVTAGLGRDAFILAGHGYSVVMLERSPIMVVLLEDALQRLQQQSTKQPIDFRLLRCDARQYLQQQEYLESTVVYLDPMHPERAKSALVKKELRMVRDVVGDDPDSEELFELALACARRVVVKRPKLSGFLSGKEPLRQLVGKSTRFDIYQT